MKDLVRNIKNTLSYFQFAIVISITTSLITYNTVSGAECGHIKGAYVSQGPAGQEELVTIKVGSTDGVTYNTVSSDSMSFPAYIFGCCTNSGKISSAFVSINGWPESKQEAYIGDLPHFATEMGQKLVHLPNGLAPFPASQAPEWFKAELQHACYTNYVGTGMSKEDAFSRSWTLENKAISELKGRLECYKYEYEGGKESLYKQYETTAPARFNIVCEKYTPPGHITKPPLSRGKDLVQAVKVTQANLVAFPDNKGGKCEVKLSATLVASGKINVKYQFENQVGNRSGVETVNIDQTNTAFFTKTFDFTKSGKGIWWEAETGGGSGPTLAAKPTENKQGFFKLVVLSPNKFESNLANYNFKYEELPMIKAPELVAPKQPRPRQ